MDRPDFPKFAPEILRQPEGRQAMLGQRVVLRVKVEGRAPFTYQWFHNGQKVAGANQASLTLENLRRLHAGHYHCEVRNYSGRAVSEPAQVHVLTQELPPIEIGPNPLSGVAGRPFTLRVLSPAREALRGLRVQWSCNGERVPGAHGLELRVPAADATHEGDYKAMVAVGPALYASNLVHVRVFADSSLAASPESAPAPSEPAANDWRADLFVPDADLAAPVETTAPAALDEVHLSDLDTGLLIQELAALEPVAVAESEPQPSLEITSLEVPHEEPVVKEEPAMPAIPVIAPPAAMAPPAPSPLTKKKKFLENFLGAWQRHCGTRGPAAEAA